MIVLVAGAHGRLGSRVVALLLRRGHVVRAVVRTHAQAAVLRDAGAETVVADLSIPTVARGTSLQQRPAPTRTSLSSWSNPPLGRRLAAASPLPRRSCNVP